MVAQRLGAVVLYRFPSERAEAADEISPVAHPAPAHKAPEGWRTPRPGGLSCGLDSREASWSAVVLYRFCSERASPFKATAAPPAIRCPAASCSEGGRAAGWPGLAKTRFESDPANNL